MFCGGLKLNQFVMRGVKSAVEVKDSDTLHTIVYFTLEVNSRPNASQKRSPTQPFLSCHVTLMPKERYVTRQKRRLFFKGHCNTMNLSSLLVFLYFFLGIFSRWNSPETFPEQQTQRKRVWNKSTTRSTRWWRRCKDGAAEEPLRCANAGGWLLFVFCFLL